MTGSQNVIGYRDWLGVDINILSLVYRVPCFNIANLKAIPISTGDKSDYYPMVQCMM